MSTFHAQSLWATIKERSAQASRRFLAIAYITAHEHLSLEAGDLLVTDASDTAIKGRSTCRETLRHLVNQGVEVRNCPGLHAKVFVLGHSVIVGSANSSAHSQQNLIEAGLLTGERAVVDAARAFVLQLAAQSELVDHSVLARLDRLQLLKRSTPKSNRRNGVSVGDGSPTTWLISVHEMDADANGDDPELIEAGAAKAANLVEYGDSDTTWIRFSGRSRFRKSAKVGDLVVQLWSDRRGKAPKWAYYPCPIRWIQEEERCTRFYLEAYSDAEDTYLPLTRFKTILRHSGLGAQLGRHPCRSINARVANELQTLWLSECE